MATSTEPSSRLRSAAVTRRDFGRLMGVSALGLALPACVAETADSQADSVADGASPEMERDVAPTQTQASQAAMTPDGAVDMLREGNRRFVAGTPMERDLAAQMRETAGGQFPFAIVLGCVDSRVPVETVFDQGIGDIFVARVAGNIANPDLIGSMEFACAVAGSKAVVVMGHTACGAVKGAIDRAELGNLTGLVQKVEPAIAAVEGDRDSSNAMYVDQVAETNVRLTLDAIRAQSEVLAGMEEAGDIRMVGAMYDLTTGQVRFL